MRNKINLCITIVLFFFQSTLANIYYVSTTGSDTFGDGSSDNPWRTLSHAASKVPANQGHTIQIGAGTFIEPGQVEIPLGVNIEGAGKNLTIIKAASSFYYNPESPGYATDKYLISLKAASPVDGNQSLKHFTIEGDSKQLHGGIYVRYRNHVIIDAVSVQNTHFNGIWLWDVKDSKIINTDLINCSWGSTGYSAGALNLGNLERVEIDQLNVNESVGYGIKAIGPDVHNNIVDLEIHDSRISVNPYGLWENGKAPNIAIELWSANLRGCEIYNSYVDNTISLVNSNSPPSTGIQAIRVHHNTIDINTRAKGDGYGVELSIHDAEIDHNYFIKGRYGIAHWDNPVQNWNIHHNVFYGLESVYPGDVLRAQRSGLHNVHFYNNTIEFTGDKTMNIIGLYGGASKNVNVINNLFINNNNGYSYYPNSLIRMENGAVLDNLTVKNNLFDRLSVGKVAGTYSDNLRGNPKISKAGSRPDAYYMPMSGSPLIDAGLNVALSFLGLAPDIGAYEYTTTLINLQPQVNLTSPASNSKYTEGSSVRIAANASDTSDTDGTITKGTITKVEFFQGTLKLGEDLTSPYHFDWTNVGAGSYSLTAKATDMEGATNVSSAVNITVGDTEAFTTLELYAPDATLTGNMKLTSDSTASKGSYFSTPGGSGTNYSIPPPSSAQFNFELAKTDTYVAWVRLKSPSVNNRGHHIYDGKGNWTSWLAPVHIDWTWVKVTNAYTNAVATFPYTAGDNVFRMAWFHENVLVDRVLITNDLDFEPSEKGQIANGRSIPSSEEQEADSVLEVFPNPCKDKFMISYESTTQQHARITIQSTTSLISKEIIIPLHVGLNNIPVSMDGEEKGVYVLTMLTSDGKRCLRKIVVTN